jgi:pimeloyl-ACP methyl ester carboxylesterase
MKIRKKTIAFSEEGEGKVIVLLHGFTENSRIWSNYSKLLSKKYRVLSIDLPGHGKSSRFDNIHTMELMADAVQGVLKKAGVTKCLMIGHSMGGYVTLAFAEKYPAMLKGFGLFHSHCFADSPEDVKNRNRTISIVEKDKFGFMAQFIPGLFPPDVHKKFAGEIEKLVQRSSKMEKESVIAALEGMKIRKDQASLLKDTSLPVLFILGLKDAKAPVPRLWEMISLPARSQVLLLKTCGHMGFIEAPEECLGAIQGFARTYL